MEFLNWQKWHRKIQKWWSWKAHRGAQFICISMNQKRFFFHEQMCFDENGGNNIMKSNRAVVLTECTPNQMFVIVHVYVHTHIEGGRERGRGWDLKKTERTVNEKITKLLDMYQKEKWTNYIRFSGVRMCKCISVCACVWLSQLQLPFANQQNRIT